MRQRCTNPKNKQWEDYGGRGITVCARWDDFDTFLADMGPRPEGMSLDRIDNNKGYSPDNCRWATRTQQNRNSRQAKLTAADAAFIRTLHQSGRRQIDIANDMGVTQAHVSAVIRGVSWAE